MAPKRAPFWRVAIWVRSSVPIWASGKWISWWKRNGRARADDILWRRSKLGLRFSAEEAAGLARYLENGHSLKQASG